MTLKLRTRLTALVCAVCATGYVVSLALPALQYGPAKEGAAAGSYWGIALLLLGWLEAIGGSPAGVAWLANPLFALGLIGLMFQQSGSAVGCLVSSWVLASASFGISTVYIDEAGTTAPVVGFGPGFWIWYASIVTSLISAVAFYLAPKQSTADVTELQTQGDSVNNRQTWRA